MKKKMLAIGTLALVLGFTALFVIGFQREPSRMKMTFAFEESYGNFNGKELSLSAIEGDGYEGRTENVEKVVNNHVTFSVKDIDFDDVQWQLTMDSDAGQFAIREFSVTYGETCILRESGSAWLTRVDFISNCECREEDGMVIVTPYGEEPHFWVGTGLGKGLLQVARRQDFRRMVCITIAGYLFYGLVAFLREMGSRLSRENG